MCGRLATGRGLDGLGLRPRLLPWAAILRGAGLRIAQGAALGFVHRGPGAGGFSAGGKPQKIEYSDALPADWWALFHSSGLNALTARALRDNPTVDAAQAAMRVAQANVYAEVGQLFPCIGNYQGTGGKVASQAASPLAAPRATISRFTPLNSPFPTCPMSGAAPDGRSRAWRQ